MAQETDFERAWLRKLATSLEEAGGEEVQRQVMAGSEGLSARSSSAEVIAWTKGALERLEALMGGETASRVMTGCACQVPREGLQAARQAYKETGDPARAHAILQAQFEAFLRHSLALEEEHMQEVVGRGWGMAGILDGNRVLATKIPKSGYLAAYLEETDPQKKREYYCHCPRVRQALQTGDSLPVTYCYCGAGYYKGIWEEILQAPVEVEVLASVLGGDDVCSITVYLPVDVG